MARFTCLKCKDNFAAIRARGYAERCNLQISSYSVALTFLGIAALYEHSSGAWSDCRLGSPLGRPDARLRLQQPDTKLQSIQLKLE